jgi:hypothetical protein
MECFFHFSDIVVAHKNKIWRHITPFMKENIVCIVKFQSDDCTLTYRDSTEIDCACFLLTMFRSVINRTSCELLHSSLNEKLAANINDFRWNFFVFLPFVF